MSNTPSLFSKITLLFSYDFNNFAQAEALFPSLMSNRGIQKTTKVINKIFEHYIDKIACGIYSKSWLEQDFERLLDAKINWYKYIYNEPLLGNSKKPMREMRRSVKAFLYLAYLDSEENVELIGELLSDNIASIGVKFREKRLYKAPTLHPANPKTDLNNMCQKRWRRKFKLKPVFTTIPQGVVCHLTLKLKNAHNRQATGTGKTQQAAENNAAQNMLTQLNEEEALA